MDIEDGCFLRPRSIFSESLSWGGYGGGGAGGKGTAELDRDASLGQKRSSFLSDRGLNMQPLDFNACSSQEDNVSQDAAMSQQNCTQDYFWYVAKQTVSPVDLRFDPVGSLKCFAYIYADACLYVFVRARK